MALELIIGPMFAGKTTYAIDLVRRYANQGLRVLVVKPAIDTRFVNLNELTTHNGDSVPCYTTCTLNSLTADFIQHFSVIIVDEAQFFEGLVPFVEFAVDTHLKIVYLIGLSGDSDRRSFGELLDTIPLANRITHLHSRCACGNPALFTRRLRTGFDQIAIGGSEMYRPECRFCYVYGGHRVF
jgi:thymidine kinase